MTDKHDLAFLDRVHDWTFAKRSGGGQPLSREVQSVQARLRGKLRQAQRFIVDNDAIEITAGLSREFDRLETWSFLARLPYDTMWLQFDLHHKIESLRKLDSRMLPVEPDRVSRQLGYLLFRDTDGPTPVWMAHEFYLTSDNEPYIGMLAYVFDPEGDPMWPIRGSKFWHSPTLSLRKGFPRLPVVIDWRGIADADGHVTGRTGQTIRTPIAGYAAPEIALCGIFQPTKEITDSEAAGEIDLHFAARDHAEGEFFTAPSWFVNRGAVIVEPWWDHYMANRWKDDPDRAHAIIIHEINESRGAMKFLITLLAAINALPRDVRPIVTRPGKRPVGMHMLPYLGHSHLRIELPRDNRIVYARRTLDRSAGSHETRRQHYVRGHWRVVERGKRVTHVCRHMPTMVEHGLGLCEICEMLIRWIPQALRGDPEKGMVDHDLYEVTTKKKKRAS
jgi:hypothetical protein